MYRYHSALNARRGDVHAGAGRVALLVLEGWKGEAGTLDASGNILYVPSSHIGLDVLNSTDVAITSNGGDNYTIQLTGGTNTFYYAQLTYDEDIDGDGFNNLQEHDRATIYLDRESAGGLSGPSENM